MAVHPLVEAAPHHRFASHEGKESLVVDLPGIESLADVELNIGHTEIQLCLPGGSMTSIPLPKELSTSAEVDSAVAKFSKKRAQLTISWPSLPVAVKAVPLLAETQDQRGASLEDPATEAFEEVDGVLIEEVFDDVIIEEVLPSAMCDERRSEQLAAETADVKQAPAAKSAAHGSLWNANNWHWEQKNCFDMLKVEVQQAFEQCSNEKLKHINDLSGASVAFSSVSVEGEASFTLRKGKRFLSYEFSVSFNWAVKDAYGSLLGTKGKGKATEVTQEEDETPQVSIEVSTNFSGGADAKAAGTWMRNNGAREIGKYLMAEKLSAAIVAAEEARTNIAQDAALRREESAKAEAAKQTTSDERMRLAAEQKRLEESRRIQPVEGAVVGSVWNANAWHWEEKPRTTWAHAWLQKSLGCLQINVLGGLATATISDPQVSGDASVSVRKGRPIALFALRVECRYTISETSAGIGEARGTILLPDFTSEDGAKGSAVEVKAAAGAQKSSAQLVAAMRREGVPVVRAVMARFIEQLMGQLDSAA